MFKENSSPTILISGAGGFLGHELVKQFLQRDNFNVIALTSKVGKLEEQFKNYGKLKVVHTDHWIEEVDGNDRIDFLVNCAFPRSSDPEQLAQGLVFTESLVRDSLQLKISKVINISSQSVYSQKDKVSASESAPVIPESLYGMTKFASERIVATLCENSSRRVVYSNIRLASLCGVDFEVRMTNRFVKRALEGRTITLNGGGQKISYLDVRDAASAIISMINKESSTWSPVYNLGSHYNCTILELAELVDNIGKEFTEHDIKLEILEGQNDFNNLIDSNLFYRDFKWKPQYSMSMIVRELFENYTKDVNVNRGI